MANKLYWRGEGVLTIEGKVIHQDQEIPDGSLGPERIKGLKKSGKVSSKTSADEKAALADKVAKAKSAKAEK